MCKEDKTDIMIEDDQAIEDISEEEMTEELSKEESETETEETITSGGLTRHDFWRIANSYPRLTKEEEIELGRKIKAGDKQAREKLINCNMNLAIQVGVIWYRRIRNVAITVSLEDMIQDAIMGLIRAADLYDPEKDIKFSSYAVHFCGQGVRKGLELNGRTIKIPMRTVTCVSAVKKMVNQLTCVLNRDPKAEEIYEYCEHRFSLKRIKTYLEILGNTCIYSLNDKAPGTATKDGGSDERPGRTLEEMLETEESGKDEVYEQIERKEMVRLMYEAMNKVLDEREKLVMKMLYAMPASKQMRAAGAEGECMTYDNVAEILATKGFKNSATGKRLTKEMIRSIKEKAIWKIRDYMHIDVPEERAKEEKRRAARNMSKRQRQEKKKATKATKEASVAI